MTWVASQWSISDLIQKAASGEWSESGKDLLGREGGVTAWELGVRERERDTLQDQFSLSLLPNLSAMW